MRKALVQQTWISFVWAMLLFALCAPSVLQAQTNTKTSEYGLRLGVLLPSNIDGVTEITPMFGFSYARPIAKDITIEPSLLNSHANGVDFTLLTIDAGFETYLSPDFSYTVLTGLDFSYYSPVTTGTRTFAWGGNLGAAFYTYLFQNFALRKDFILYFNPGTSLYIGLSFVYAPGR